MAVTSRPSTAMAQELSVPKKPECYESFTNKVTTASVVHISSIILIVDRHVSRSRTSSSHSWRLDLDFLHVV